MSMYFIAWLWIRGFINGKIINEASRKKYKKYIRKELGVFFGFVSGAVGFALFAFTTPVPSDKIEFITFTLKCVLLLIQVLAAVLVFVALKRDLYKLKHLSEKELTGS